MNQRAFSRPFRKQDGQVTKNTQKNDDSVNDATRRQRQRSCKELDWRGRTQAAQLLQEKLIRLSCEWRVKWRQRLRGKTRIENGEHSPHNHCKEKPDDQAVNNKQKWGTSWEDSIPTGLWRRMPLQTKGSEEERLERRDRLEQQHLHRRQERSWF